MSSGGGLGRLDNLRNTLGREKPRTRRAEERTEPRSATGEGANENGPKKRDAGSKTGSEGASRGGTAAKRTGTGARKTSRAAPKRQQGGEGTTRITVDLPGDQHGFLKTFVARSGSDGMSVVRALLSELERDEKLAARVSEKLVEERLRRQAQSG